VRPVSICKTSIANVTWLGYSKGKQGKPYSR
jgi:hypothetical protein